MKIKIFLMSAISFIILSSNSNLFAVTPGKWTFKDSILLYPKENKFFPKKEIVYSPKGKILLTNQLVYKDGFLVEENFSSDGKPEGKTTYEYDKSGRLTKETTTNSQGKVTDSRDYVYKKNHLFKIRIFSESGKLYMDSVIHKWSGDTINSGEITWMETKDKEKISTIEKPYLKTMSILDENKKPIASVDFKYNAKGDLVERIFRQGNSTRKNALVYDKKGRLVEFSFHVKQNGTWVLEKTHKLSY